MKNRISLLCGLLLAVFVLSPLGLADDPLGTRLVDLDPGVRQNALAELATTDQQTKFFLISPLMDTMRAAEDGEKRLRADYATNALITISRDPAVHNTLTPMMIDLLREPGPLGIVEQARMILTVIGPADTQVALSQAMADPDANLRLHAIHTIGSMKVDANFILPSLRNALNDPDENVRKEAAFVLKLYQSDEAPKSYAPTVDAAFSPVQEPPVRAAQIHQNPEMRKQLIDDAREVQQGYARVAELHKAIAILAAVVLLGIVWRAIAWLFRRR